MGSAVCSVLALVRFAVILLFAVHTVSGALTIDTRSSSTFSHAVRRRRLLAARQDLVVRPAREEIERALELVRRSEHWTLALQKRATSTSGLSGDSQWTVHDDDQSICFCVSRTAGARVSMNSSSGASWSLFSSGGSLGANSGSGAGDSSVRPMRSSYKPTYVYNTSYDNSHPSSVTNNNTTQLNQVVHDSHDTVQVHMNNTQNEVHQTNVAVQQTNTQTEVQQTNNVQNNDNSHVDKSVHVIDNSKTNSNNVQDNSDTHNNVDNSHTTNTSSSSSSASQTTYDNTNSGVQAIAPKS